MSASLSIHAWRMLAERTPFNEMVAVFLVSHDGLPEYNLMVAMTPRGRIVRAWQIVPGHGGSTVSPETLPFHIRDLAQSACEARGAR